MEIEKTPDDEVPRKTSEIDYESKYSCWVREANGEFIPSIGTIPKLIPGKYTIKWNGNYGKYGFIRESLNLDELLELPNNIFQEILSDVNYFWDNKKLFIKYKFNYKRGILLYGNPGCGKSSIIALLSNQVIKKGGIVLSIQNTNDLENYINQVSQSFRIIEPNTPILVVFEDLDALIRVPEAETMLLNILDGLNQFNNMVNIGCTNYPEKLKERILNRPSRFDKRYYFGLPDSTVRKFYFENKILKEDIDIRGGNSFIEDIVRKTEGLTLAHLGEFIKSVFIFNNTIKDTIDLLHGMKKVISSTQNEGTKTMGFNSK